MNSEYTLTVAHAAELLDVSAGCVRHYVDTGEIRHIIREGRYGRPYFLLNTADFDQLAKKLHEKFELTRVADICRCTVATVRSWVRDGYINAATSDGEIRITTKEADRFLDSCCKRGDWREDEYISVKEASDMYGYCVQTIHNKVKEGVLKPGFVYPTGRLFFLAKDLQDVFGGCVT